MAWSNITHELSIFPPPTTCLTWSIPHPWNIYSHFQVKYYILDNNKNPCTWTCLKPKWSFNAMILTIIFIHYKQNTFSSTQTYIIWRANNTKFICDNLQGWTCQVMPFIVMLIWANSLLIAINIAKFLDSQWVFSWSHWQELCKPCHVIYDMFHLTHMVSMNTKMFTNPWHLKECGRVLCECDTTQYTLV